MIAPGHVSHRLVMALAVLQLAASGSRTASAQAAPPSAQAATVVAEAGGRAITVADLRTLVAQAQAEASGNSQALLATMTADGRSALLQRAVDDRVLAQAARDEGLDARPDLRFLVEQATSRVLAAAYADAKLRELTPGREGARAYLESHPDEFRVGARVRAHHLVVATLDHARAARAAIAGGEPFEGVASAQSQDLTTKSKGGDLGWVPRGVMVQPFEAALFRMKVGELSEPVRTSFGYHLIRVDEVDPGRVPAFDEIEADVTRAIATKAFDRLKAELARRCGAAIHKEALAQFGR